MRAINRGTESEDPKRKLTEVILCRDFKQLHIFTQAPFAFVFGRVILLLFDAVAAIIIVVIAAESESR
jgi:hypothetical protein